MVAVELPSGAEDICWEFQYESNELERLDARNSFRLMHPRERRLESFGRLLAWPIAIAILLLVVWFGAGIAKLFEIGLRGLLGQEALTLIFGVIFAVIVIAVIRTPSTLFAYRDRSKALHTIPERVRLYANGEVSFLDSGVSVRRKIEKIQADAGYVFFTIEGGVRFVYVPRRIIEPAQFDAILGSMSIMQPG